MQKTCFRAFDNRDGTTKWKCAASGVCVFGALWGVEVISGAWAGGLRMEFGKCEIYS
ncbi:MAG: hypothetical protein K6G64_00460 [Eubacterium sp.]|nr:hypothetical protein [Eubacterium sp.]